MPQAEKDEWERENAPESGWRPGLTHLRLAQDEDVHIWPASGQNLPGKRRNPTAIAG